jgi:hypothetical protein
MNAYIAEAAKEKPVAAIVRPSSQHAKNLAVRQAITGMFAGKLSPDQAEALEISKQHPNSYISRASDTPSMLGAGYNKDYVVVAPLDDYSEGDDVVYVDDKGKYRYILHRITHKKPGAYFIKGTFNRHPDGWIPADKIVGKVVHPKPKW